MPDVARAFEIEFDFADHRLHISSADGEHRKFALNPTSVADFYRKTMGALDKLGIQARIWPMPVELPDPIQPFPKNNAQAAYDPESAGRFWRALLQIHRVFTLFCARFTGKVSPVHFVWGGFDMAVTRFSGRSAPEHPRGVPNPWRLPNGRMAFACRRKMVGGTGPLTSSAKYLD